MPSIPADSHYCSCWASVDPFLCHWGQAFHDFYCPGGCKVSQACHLHPRETWYLACCSRVVHLNIGIISCIFHKTRHTRWGTPLRRYCAGCKSSWQQAVSASQGLCCAFLCCLDVLLGPALVSLGSKGARHHLENGPSPYIPASFGEHHQQDSFLEWSIGLLRLMLSRPGPFGMHCMGLQKASNSACISACCHRGVSISNAQKDHAGHSLPFPVHMDPASNLHSRSKPT